MYFPSKFSGYTVCSECCESKHLTVNNIADYNMHNVHTYIHVPGVRNELPFELTLPLLPLGEPLVGGRAGVRGNSQRVWA